MRGHSTLMYTYNVPFKGGFIYITLYRVNEYTASYHTFEHNVDKIN